MNRLSIRWYASLVAALALLAVSTFLTKACYFSAYDEFRYLVYGRTITTKIDSLWIIGHKFEGPWNFFLRNGGSKAIRKYTREKLVASEPVRVRVSVNWIRLDKTVPVSPNYVVSFEMPSDKLPFTDDITVQYIPSDIQSVRPLENADHHSLFCAVGGIISRVVCVVWCAYLIWHQFLCTGKQRTSFEKAVERNAAENATN